MRAFNKEKDGPVDGKMTPSTKEIVQQQLDIAEQRHDAEIKSIVEIHKRELA